MFKMQFAHTLNLIANRFEVTGGAIEFDILHNMVERFGDIVILCRELFKLFKIYRFIGDINDLNSLDRIVFLIFFGENGACLLKIKSLRQRGL